jgi:regulatory protein
MNIYELKKLDNKKILVCLEDYEPLPLYVGEVKKYDFKEGMDLSVEVYNEIINTILIKRAKERAFYILKSSDKTGHQIHEKLKKSYYPDIVIKRTIEFLKEYNYVDDIRYARNYISYRIDSKSLTNIKRELLLKGIDKEIINFELQNYIDEDKYNPYEIIFKELEKKRYNPDEIDEKKKRKIINYLLRKGFKYDDIFWSFKNYNEKEE